VANAISTFIFCRHFLYTPSEPNCPSPRPSRHLFRLILSLSRPSWLAPPSSLVIQSLFWKYSLYEEIVLLFFASVFYIFFPFLSCLISYFNGPQINKNGRCKLESLTPSTDQLHFLVNTGKKRTFVFHKTRGIS
jgi:hypothetical protein